MLGSLQLQGGSESEEEDEEDDSDESDSGHRVIRSLKDQHNEALFRSLCSLYFWKKIFNIWSIKYRLITKLITDLVCKLRDESNEPN